MKKNIVFFVLAVILTACSSGPVITEVEKEELPPVFPDYTDCTIPPNIAPLNFRLEIPYDAARVQLTVGTYTWEVKAGKQQFSFSSSRWREILKRAEGNTITVKVLVKEEGKWTGYAPFQWHISKDKIDPYLAYRLIEPGYELWNQMGLYQRNLETFEETPIMENRLTKNNCMNCHSFCMQNPEQMVYHMRGEVACTFLLDGDKVEKLNTKTPQTISSLVYPAWHPSGRYIAFSVNNTKQAFHMNDPNRVEVFDNKSDVVVYDVKNHEIITHRSLFSPTAFENFPAFSPDGKTLYFCSSDTCMMPEEFEKVKYHLCSIDFDPDARTFGNKVDTLYNAYKEGRSASFPRVSPDGKHLLYTLGDYGGFAIWHKDADLYMIDLPSATHYPLDAANSKDADSYHSWSSNSRWIVVASRRIDGLYSRPFIAHIDADGNPGKAFLVPQKDTRYYDRFMKSYNVPEFIKGKVKDRRRAFASQAIKEKGIDIKFGGEQKDE